MTDTLKRARGLVSSLDTMSIREKFIEGYIHGGRIGVLVEFRLDSLTTTSVDRFAKFAKDVAMHVAASNPSDVDSLLSQPFVKEPSVSVADLIATISAELNEQIVVARFVRWDTEIRTSDSPTPPKRPAVAMRVISKT